jgi:uncharacterized membrane protein YeiH
MLGTFLTAIDWFGTAVFAVTGALVASRKRMDITGFILLGCVTGMGGGTLRDAMLGALPVFWVREPAVGQSRPQRAWFTASYPPAAPSARAHAARFPRRRMTRK